MLQLFASALIAFAVLLFVYAYLGYPLLLALLARLRPSPPPLPEPEAWPTLSITVPAFNEEHQIADAVESLLRLDYPADRRQILVVSDASTDRTDEIVRGYADRGVELLRLPRRGGKGAAETAATPLLRGEIVVNTDASIRIRPDALRHLIARFQDPTVGLASGRDRSVSALESDANLGESGYVGYEMWVRDLETRVGGIIGASGCFYAIRSHLHRVPLPAALSRDFAAAMIARDHGYRAVSVPGAVCLVPRAALLGREYRRKVRTMTRGMETLFHMRHLLNPVRHGLFAWMLWSHKVCRWASAWSLPLAAAGIALLSLESHWALAALGVLLLGLAWAVAGWRAASRRTLPRLLALPAYMLAGNIAALHALMRALRGDRDSTWEPTRRPVPTVQ